MKTNKKKVSKWKVYLLLTLAVTVAFSAMSVVSTVVSYPTAAHRNTAAELSKLTNKAWDEDSDDGMKIFESKEYKQLESSQYTSYSNIMNAVTTVAQLIAGVVIIFAIYRYLRRNILTNSPVSATVGINVVGGMLLTFPVILFSEWYTGSITSDITWIMILIALPFALVIGGLITFLITKIAEWQYNRSHGFLAD